MVVYLDLYIFSFILSDEFGITYDESGNGTYTDYDEYGILRRTEY